MFNLLTLSLLLFVYQMSGMNPVQKPLPLIVVTGQESTSVLPKNTFYSQHVDPYTVGFSTSLIAVETITQNQTKIMFPDYPLNPTSPKKFHLLPLTIHLLHNKDNSLNNTIHTYLLYDWFSKNKEPLSNALYVQGFNKNNLTNFFEVIKKIIPCPTMKKHLSITCFDKFAIDSLIHEYSLLQKTLTILKKQNNIISFSSENEKKPNMIIKNKPFFYANIHNSYCISITALPEPITFLTKEQVQQKFPHYKTPPGEKFYTVSVAIKLTCLSSRQSNIIKTRLLHEWLSTRNKPLTDALYCKPFGKNYAHFLEDMKNITSNANMQEKVQPTCYAENAIQTLVEDLKILQQQKAALEKHISSIQPQLNFYSL